MHDAEIIKGLTGNFQQRVHSEKELYMRYQYFIGEGSRKRSSLFMRIVLAHIAMLYLAAIHNILNNRFDNTYSLKTYLFQIFHNKCVDHLRKTTNTKQKVHKGAETPELLNHLPETAKNVIEKLIDREKISLVSQYLEKIDEKCKEILLLSADGYTDKQIAQMLVYNNAAVAKTTRLRCREKLYKLFTNYG